MINDCIDEIIHRSIIGRSSTGDAFSKSSKVMSSAFAYVEKNENEFHNGRMMFLVTNLTPSSENFKGSPLTTGEFIK